MEDYSVDIIALPLTFIHEVVLPTVKDPSVAYQTEESQYIGRKMIQIIRRKMINS